VGNLIEAFPVIAYFTGRRRSRKAKGSDSRKGDSD
jgi:hypothetical protein